MSCPARRKSSMDRSPRFSSNLTLTRGDPPEPPRNVPKSSFRSIVCLGSYIGGREGFDLEQPHGVEGLCDDHGERGPSLPEMATPYPRVRLRVLRIRQKRRCLCEIPDFHSGGAKNFRYVPPHDLALLLEAARNLSPEPLRNLAAYMQTPRIRRKLDAMTVSADGGRDVFGVMGDALQSFFRTLKTSIARSGPSERIFSTASAAAGIESRTVFSIPLRT